VPDRRGEILDEVRRILSVELEIEEPADLHHCLARDLGVDSMGAITLAVGLEDRFRVKLSDQDAATVVTVGDLVELVQQAVREAGPPDGPAPASGSASR